MKGIKARLLKSFLAVILLTVIIFEIILIISVRQYYFGNVEEVLSKQAEVSANFYRQYLARDDFLEKNADVLLESFSAPTAAQVQIIDEEGILLADSQFAGHGGAVGTPDVKKALKGLPSKWQGRMPGTGERVLAVSYPLKSGDTVVGVVRFVTSLEGVNGVVGKIAVILISIGLAAVIISVFAAAILSQTIVKPLNDITRVAEEMAKGKFTARAPKRYDDEVGRLADTLNFMAQEIMRQEELKNEFIASVSHELRTPLTAIKGWTITLLSAIRGTSQAGRSDIRENAGVPDRRVYLNLDELIEGLEIITKESERLSELVEELLDFSRFEAGAIKLNLDKVALVDTLNYIKTQMMPRAKRQAVEFEIYPEEGLPEILADENRIKQVLINLLDNAFKFTPAGGRVRVKAESANDSVRIIVEDTGCGIPPEDLPHVTKKFYKAKSKQPGSGLGLAICDEIVRLHGGRMEITSAPGKGTRVEVILPV
ncbi:sensor histidine kinase [Thermosediminibacter oceani]|uniref:histidine kinase n=1 Tax=Thermosediminibacter oceani (strain ATCC BAA-1034 / DSM 16646 / JW/IW-1228P) TaxID=555079 RepID=D9S0Q5_THEOJ|nr:ATP-binding protein [Thermosediminibacter oceani]ADL07069.1 integral membrane sensor signal transduction histidine kinase [Thermosediminibacter oceani DSM 16646]